MLPAHEKKRQHRAKARKDPSAQRPRACKLRFTSPRHPSHLLSAIQAQSDAAESAKGVAVNAKLQLAGARLENDVTHRTLTLLKLQRDSALEDVELARSGGRLATSHQHMALNLNFPESTLCGEALSLPTWHLDEESMLPTLTAFPDLPQYTTDHTTAR